MRFLVMVKATKEFEDRFEAGEVPGLADAMHKMEAFNQTLINDGVLLDMGGLKPTSQATRIDYSGPKPRIVDGPFAETKELVAGFWLLEGRSKQEIVERLSHCPFQLGETIEIRQLHSPEEIAEML
jgi:hypothetical protein